MAQTQLDPDNIHLTITCIRCKSPLWEMRILKRVKDEVVSSEYKPVSVDIRAFDEHRFDCPVCGREFFRRLPGGEHQYRAVDYASGRVLTI